MEEGEDSHFFIVAAGDSVGPGNWQYHCHVFAHMEAGMHGIFNVVEAGPATSVPGATPYGVHPLLGGGPSPGLVTFEISDEPGSWFRNTVDISGITVTKSLALARPGDSVHFIMSDTSTSHTITTLLWPEGAEHMPMDEVTSYKGGGIVQLHDPGLYVFTCKVHPYMFGGVIADDPDTEELDLGDDITLISGPTIPVASDLALRLAKTFFVATAPENWKDYDETTNVEQTWNPLYPPVPVLASGVSIENLNEFLDDYFQETENDDLDPLVTPGTDGVGEVWVDTQFERTDEKSKRGTATAVDTSSWEVTKKVALEMNNPHNMWTDKLQSVIYQTEWFDNELTTFDRDTGEEISNMAVGESPSHVMTRANNDDIHVALNGEEGVVEILATTSPSEVERIIAMQGFGQNPTHPHAHWMSFDGDKMVTPNSFTADSTLYGFDTEQIDAKPGVGVLPIATGMMPDSSKYYVANLLSSTISVVHMDTFSVDTINLLQDYKPLALDLDKTIPDDDAIVDDGDGILELGALPIQTPVSPDGKYMVTANTLSGTITIVDTDTDEIVATLFCEPGCHGVQFGAKEGGGYYAYVSSKFANDLLVVDVDEDSPTHLQVVGRILLNSDFTGTTDGTGQEIVQDDLTGTGGQGVLAIPNVYNGWIQMTVEEFDDLSPEVQGWICALEEEQRDPNGTAAPNPPDPACA
jgi:DNA-binding beta-propeller fold protein YncE/plastocyanin